MRTYRFMGGLALAVALGLLGVSANSAEASGPWQYGPSRGGFSAQIYVGPGSVYRSYPYGYRSGYPGHGHGGYRRGHYDWHDTSHYDWHSGHYRRHGHHYHYVPGHYDFHRDGHYDYHRGGHHGHHGH